jgi:glucosamine--fructose-6-phosphate aminotransferase (isomerizing)
VNPEPNASDRRPVDRDLVERDLAEPMTAMAREAAEAPAVVRRGLDANRVRMRELGAQLRRRAPRMVMTCGRGSSDHAATFAKYLIETRTGVLTASAAPSVSSVYETRSDMSDVLCLAISQSGRSPDLLASVEAAKAGGAYVVALVNVEDSPLARIAHAVAPLHAGLEQSVAATKSFLASLAAIAQLTAEWTEDAALRDALDAAPEQMARAAGLDWSAAVERLTPAHNLYVIGRGLGFGAAQEAALKFKETCGLHAEAFSSAEVRHGPMALVTRGFPVLAFSQDDATRPGIEALVADLAADGADVLLAGKPHAAATNLPTLDAHPALQPLLSIQSFYGMAESLSRARGLDPDHPPHLRKVTKTV